MYSDCTYRLMELIIDVERCVLSSVYTFISYNCLDDTNIITMMTLKREIHTSIIIKERKIYFFISTPLSSLCEQCSMCFFYNPMYEGTTEQDIILYVNCIISGTN